MEESGARSIQPKFPEISVQNSIDRFGPTGKVSKKLVRLLRWTTFPGPVGISVEWIAPLESTTNVELRIRDGLGLFYMGSYITFHCIVCHYIPCEFSGLLRWDHYQPVRLLVTGIQENKQSKIKTELVTGLIFFEG